MLLEQGKLASIAARIDRMVTKRKGEVPIDNYRKDYAKVVLHPRKDKDGLSALVRPPNGELALVGNKTIVHFYDPDGKLIYRRRVTENPEDLGVDAGIKLPPTPSEAHKFIQKRISELGWRRV